MRKQFLAAILIVVIATVAMNGLAQTNKAPKPEKARDPVCGIMVEKNPALSTGYKGATYYFCSKADLEKFKKEPEKYLGSTPVQPPHFR